MHILHINLAKGLRGGERQTLLLIQALAALGVGQSLASHRDSPLREALRGETLTLIDIAHPLRGWWRKCAADLVHAHETKGAYWAYLHTRLHRKPYLITRRVDLPLSPSFKRRRLYGKAAALVALSRAIECELAGFNPHRRIIASAHQGLPPPTPDADLAGIARARYLVGHVGALVDAHKGQSLLLEVLGRRRDWALALVGDGPDRRMLAARAGDNCHFCGQVADVLPYLAAFSVFAFPSRQEGLGSSLLDAMRLGKPIVAAAVGGIPDIIRDGENGLLVPPNDADALEAALCRLREDPALAARLGEKAREDARRYTPQVMAGHYLSLYRELLE